MSLKEQAARHALSYVADGMTLGLGTGSTTELFIDALGELVAGGELRGIVAVPTSEATQRRAEALGIPLTTLAESPDLDLAVDGADEVDPRLDLIKGLGKALLREKMVECHARRFVVIVDESKMVPRLGSRGPLPVEIVPFAAAAQVRWLGGLGCEAELWLQDGRPAATDNGNYLVRCKFEGGIEDPYALARELADRPGVVEHGLFLGMATEVIVAGVEGVRVLEGRPRLGPDQQGKG